MWCVDFLAGSVCVWVAGVRDTPASPWQHCTACGVWISWQVLCVFRLQVCVIRQLVLGSTARHVVCGFPGRVCVCLGCKCV